MLKDLIKSKERGGHVIPVLEEAVLLAGKRDSYKRRRDVFHPSEISGDFCPRAWVLGARDKTLYFEKAVDSQTQWRFDVGSALHELVQERLGETGKLVGTWTCKRWCLEERCSFYGFKPSPDICPMNTPHKAKFTYDEIGVDDEDLKVHGKTDGVIMLKQGKYVFEFKTINSRSFSTLAEPMDMHKEQAMIYIDTLERKSQEREKELLKLQRDGFDVSELLEVARAKFKGAVILYMNKDTQKFKEFIVQADQRLRFPSAIQIKSMEFDDGEEEDWLEEKKELIRQTLADYESGVLPDRLDVCTSKSCTRARKCFAKNACFKEE